MKRLGIVFSFAFMVFSASILYAQDLEYLGSGLWSEAKDVKIDGDRAYCLFQNGLIIYNIANPNSLQMITQFYCPGRNWKLVKENNYLYLAGADQPIRVVNVFDELHPSIIANINILGRVYDMSIIGNYLYTAEDTAGLQILDISDFQNPIRLGSYRMQARNIYINDNYAYVAPSLFARFNIIDVSNPHNPLLDGICIDSLGLGIYDIMVANDMAFVTNEYSGLLTVDVHDKHNPLIVNRLQNLACPGKMVKSGDYLYLCAPNGLQILNISNPLNPISVSQYLDNDNNFGIDYSNGLICMTSRATGLKIIDVSDPQLPILDAQTTYPSNIRQIAVSGNLALEADTLPYCNILDIEDPSNISIMGRIHTGSHSTDLVINENLAFITSTEGSFGTTLRIYDISNVESPSLVGDWGGMFDGALRVVPEGNYAYLLEGSSLWVINLSDISRPWGQDGCYIPGYCKDFDISGEYAFVAALDSGLFVMSIANPDSIYQVGHLDLPGYPQSIAVADNYAYLPCGWDSVLIADISNPANPIQIGAFIGQGLFTDVAVYGNFVFVADHYYSALIVLDISNPANPIFVTRYLTYGQIEGITNIGDTIYVANHCSVMILRFNPTTGIFDDLTHLPKSASLSQNYPNPFNPTTTIQYDLPKPAKVTLEIFDILGRRIEILVNAKQEAGHHTVIWDGKGRSSGIYYYKIQAGNYSETMKMLLLK